ncbi:cytochrome c [Paraburkholderia sp. XV]|uniref:cytochrome c n=1 Tax=Paraburkholderia sp. XV TaxID=2831520 RepID=UPI001CD3DDB9|nr:cytochrome c [Paraburkholderia sp. XV]
MNRPRLVAMVYAAAVAGLPGYLRADPASIPANATAPISPGSASSSGPGESSVDRRTRAEQPNSADPAAALTGKTSPPAAVMKTPPPDATLAAQAAVGHAPDPLVARGAYLARAGDCIACHTAKGGKPFAGGLAIGSPLGTIYSTNITPDPRYGIGNWSYDDFSRLMRHGEVKSGYVVYPAMPYPSYARLTDYDMKALYAYLMHGLQRVAQQNRNNDIPWPLSMRWPLKLWRAAFAPDAAPFRASPHMSPEVSRGAYLVQGLGHCGSCHTPRAITLQEKALDDAGGSVYLSGGGSIDGWIAPSLRAEHGGGLARWSTDDIVRFLKTGRTEGTASFGAMNDVVVDSTQYLTTDDVKSIALYLKSLGPHAGDAPTYAYDPRIADAMYHGRPPDEGARIYLDRCAACHRSNGTGYGKAFPALAGNPVLQTHNPTSAIHIVLSGSAQPGTATAPSSLTMAPYANLLHDDEIARVVTFIQTAWGNRGGPASATDVAKMREKAEPVQAAGFTAPMQRDLRRAEPGRSAESFSSGVAPGQ